MNMVSNMRRVYIVLQKCECVKAYCFVNRIVRNVIYNILKELDYNKESGPEHSPCMVKCNNQPEKAFQIRFTENQANAHYLCQFYDKCLEKVRFRRL